MLKYLLLIFSCVVLYRVLKNTSCFVRTIFYEKKYKDYLAGTCHDFAQYTTAVTSLFDQAGLEAPGIPFVEHVSPGFVAQGTADLFSNMARLDDTVISMMHNCFQKAKGAFSHRIKESLSAFYWIDKLIYLPRNILRYLGASGEDAITKVFQLLYWFLTPILLIFREKVCNYILSLIQ